jgi:hypothetical protein
MVLAGRSTKCEDWSPDPNGFLRDRTMAHNVALRRAQGDIVLWNFP